MLTKTSPQAGTQTAAELRLDVAFQPVVNLNTGQVMASEALLRPRHAERDIAPLELFALARSVGQLERLDLAALGRALETPGADGRGVVLINLEPATLVAHTDAVLATLARRPQSLQAVIEITGRALVKDPGGLLRAVDALRAKGYPIACDDIGADPRALALLEVVRPGIVKLDMSMLAPHGSAAAVQIADAVAAYAESVGAAIVATSVETAADAMRAAALGASYGQGALWGEPGPAWVEQSGDSTLRYAPPPLRVPSRMTDTPYGIVCAHKAPRTLAVEDFEALIRAVEPCAGWAASPSIVLASLPSSVPVPPSRRECLASLAAGDPVLGLFGEELAFATPAGAHGAALERDDPLRDEWCLVALGVSSAVALVARQGVDDHGGSVWTFASTRQRHAVVAAAVSLIRRLAAVRT